jgi:hypothetical protein
MTSTLTQTERRIDGYLAARERFAAKMAARGYEHCESCDSWMPKGHECEIPAVVTIAAVIGLAMTVR